MEVEFLVVVCEMSFIRRPVLSLQSDSSCESGSFQDGYVKLLERDVNAFQCLSVENTALVLGETG